jgi:hypothetical protein
MGTVGDCYDNAPMESFWGSMQIELLNRKKWRTKIEPSIAIAEWIEHFSIPSDFTARSAKFHPWSLKLSTQHPPRPDSYKRGSELGVKVKLRV